MELYHSFAILIVIATIFSLINKLYIKLPDSVGIMVIALITSMSIVLIGHLSMAFPLTTLGRVIQSIDFSKLLMGGMLNFLLFAGAIHIDLNDLKEQKVPIMILSTIGVIISTLVVGFALYYLLNFLSPLIGLVLEIPLVWCLLFGALISPTDPIAALAILRASKVTKSLEMKIAGESLFNDGVAVVLFSVLLNMAVSGETNELSIDWSSTLVLLCKEVFGGIALGLILGYIASWGMKKAQDLKIAVLITLSVVMAGYLVANSLHFSGPLTMVVAGLIIGYNRKYKLNKNHVVDNLGVFWQLIDDVMNALLFLFLGFEILLVPNILDYWLFGICAIFVVLLARYLSIKLPNYALPKKNRFSRNSLTILVWGGLRGAVSIALALSIPDTPYKHTIIGMTYFVVVFSILVQGLSIGKLAKKINVAG